MENRRPFFYDVTLRDGNQALKKPWNAQEKETIFLQLVKLGVQAIEVGFSGSSDMDFEACRHLASIAPQQVIVAGLARANEKDILKVAEALVEANSKRIHTFIAFSPFHMKNVLKKSPRDVRTIAVEAVGFARDLLGDGQEIQFSVEHFGDCAENLTFVIESLQEVVAAGATVINLSNTVERTRPLQFVEMMKTVFSNLPEGVISSVHCHNDLGMATATTVESFFAGAYQLECSLNGLAERAGISSLYEVAMSLYNCGIDVPLDMSRFYETAHMLAGMSSIPIHEKCPLIGSDALVHRSGIHQDGAGKTRGMKKGAYRTIDPSLIGRGGERMRFTSQSGKMAIYEIIHKAGYAITIEDALRILPAARKKAEEMGELPLEVLLNLYINESVKSI
ncbi:MAG: 2-isopropylmalate synthase [Syntrophus sp. PtaB.Bin001]|nr:MAG: 2-isopropylmalate synthase [Syntrophus sp. PtaB.Bin001]